MALTSSGDKILSARATERTEAKDETIFQLLEKIAIKHEESDKLFQALTSKLGPVCKRNQGVSLSAELKDSNDEKSHLYNILDLHFNSIESLNQRIAHVLSTLELH